MTDKNKQLTKPQTCASDQEIPSCSTGPLGRFTWTLRELRSLIQRKEDAVGNDN